MTTTPHGQVPEALYLAETIETSWPTSRDIVELAAAELRRLHAEITALRTQQPAPAGATLPKGWVPLVITHEGQYPEEIAYGPQRMMDRLDKWLRKYFDSMVAAPTTQQAGEVVAYLDIGAGGYLDLGAALSDEALQQLPKGRHALVIAGTYGIDGYVAAPQPSPTAQPAPATQQAGEVRPVTPYTCPKCHALWLHWPAEQTGFGRDTLNCRSADHCHYCEKAGVEQLQRLERIPAALHAPQPSPTAQADSQPAPALDYPPLPTRRRAFLCTKCGGRECEPGTLTENHPTCKCGYLGFAEDLDFTAEEMRAYADETYALRIGAKHA